MTRVLMLLMLSQAEDMSVDGPVFSNSTRQGICFNCTCANATNYVLRSQDFSNVIWGTVAGGTASVPVATASDGSAQFLAPDGTFTATKIVSTGCVSGGASFFFQAMALGMGSLTATSSAWVRGTGTIGIWTYGDVPAAAGGSSMVLTNTWTQLSGSYTSTTNQFQFVVGCSDRANYTPRTTAAFTAYIWQGQLENGPTATCPIKTVASVVTRTGTCAAVCQ